MVAEIEKERRREREERNERLRWLRAEGWSGLKILGQNIVAFYFYAREYMHKCIRDPRIRLLCLFTSITSERYEIRKIYTLNISLYT